MVGGMCVTLVLLLLWKRNDVQCHAYKKVGGNTYRCVRSQGHTGAHATTRGKVVHWKGSSQ